MIVSQHFQRKNVPDSGSNTATCGAFLATHPKNYHPMWLARARFLPGWLEYADVKWQDRRSHWFSSLLWGWRLFVASRQFGVVVTGSEREARIFAILQTLLRRNKVPHILLECMWNLPASKVFRMLRKVQLRLELRSISRVIVWSRGQVGRYASELAAPARKFVSIPFHSTLYKTPVNAWDSGYVFAGGDSYRDYRPLLEAAKKLPCRILIAALSTSHFRGIEVPGNVDIIRAGAQQFLDLMAQASVVVVPMRAGLLHSGGHQTYLNAMALGKPTIVADDCGADEYIDHGVSGLIVRPGDGPGLYNALVQLLNDQDLANRLGSNAKAAARRFAPVNYFAAVFALVNECLKGSQEKANAR